MANANLLVMACLASRAFHRMTTANHSALIVTTLRAAGAKMMEVFIHFIGKAVDVAPGPRMSHI